MIINYVKETTNGRRHLNGLSSLKSLRTMRSLGLGLLNYVMNENNVFLGSTQRQEV